MNKEIREAINYLQHTPWEAVGHNELYTSDQIELILDYIKLLEERIASKDALIAEVETNHAKLYNKVKMLKKHAAEIL